MESLRTVPPRRDVESCGPIVIHGVSSVVGVSATLFPSRPSGSSVTRTPVRDNGSQTKDPRTDLGPSIGAGTFLKGTLHSRPSESVSVGFGQLWRLGSLVRLFSPYTGSHELTCNFRSVFETFLYL